MNRRDLLCSAIVAPFILGATPPDAGAAPVARTPQPLSFDPTKLKGISEKMIVSHHDNNYAGALKNLGKIEEDLSRLKADSPGHLVSGLRERELLFRNSVTLHEAYFGNLGGSGKISGALATALGAKWEESFRATAGSLGGGSGWASVALNLTTGELVTNSFSGNHTQFPASAVPLVVLDMYEHSYAIDYGAAAPRYIDAFFANLKWEEVERRYERAATASKAMRG